MISMIKKDLLDGTRNYKFIVIFAVFLFFAMFDPIMTKYILPEIIKSQFTGITHEMIDEMIDMSQRGAIRTYMSDIYEIGILVIAFLLSGITAREIQDKTLVLPVCTGKRHGTILISKLIVYGSVTFIAAFVSMIINYYYSTILFDADLKSILPIIRSGLLQGLFFVFIIILVIFIGVLTRKTILTGFITLGLVYLAGFVGTTFAIEKYLPYGLFFEAQQLAAISTNDIYQTIVISIGMIIVLFLLSVIRLKSIDLTKR